MYIGERSMIERERRNQYAEQLRHFAAGVLTVDEYEARTDELVFNVEDPALNAVWGSVWGLYDDFRTDRLRGDWALDENTRRQITRSILFLYSERPSARHHRLSSRWSGLSVIPCHFGVLQALLRSILCAP